MQLVSSQFISGVDLSTSYALLTTLSQPPDVGGVTRYQVTLRFDRLNPSHVLVVRETLDSGHVDQSPPVLTGDTASTLELETTMVHGDGACTVAVTDSSGLSTDADVEVIVSEIEKDVVVTGAVVRETEITQVQGPTAPVVTVQQEPSTPGVTVIQSGGSEVKIVQGGNDTVTVVQGPP